MSTTGGPYELRSYGEEDYEILVTVDGSGALAGTFALTLTDPAGDAVEGDGIDCEISDAAAREVTGSIVGLDLDPGVYRWSIRKTDAGERVLSAWGTLVIQDEQVI